MTIWLVTCRCVATRNPILAAGNFLSNWIPEGFLFHVTVIGSVLALLWLGLNWADRWRGFWYLKSRTPRALFRELCHAHALTRSSRLLVREISQAVSPEQCCRVFIDPRLIEDYARQHPDDADEARRLGRVLFPGR
jgi:hypothetical protein